MSVERKVLICPWFGPLPEWMDSYWERADQLGEHGYNFLLDDDEDAFRERVFERLGIEPPPMAGTGLIHDFRPALGFLYEKEIAEYDWWGVTDFDCVYGRVERFYPDSLLKEFDVVTDHWRYLCGPWTLFRNNARTRNLFFQSWRWEKIMESENVWGWFEMEFTEIVNRNLRVDYSINHAWENPEKLRELPGGALFHDVSEVPFFHFRHSKRWPL